MKFKLYRIEAGTPADRLNMRQAGWGTGTWERCVTTRAVTFDENDVVDVAAKSMIFLLPPKATPWVKLRVDVQFVYVRMVDGDEVVYTDTHGYTKWSEIIRIKPNVHHQFTVELARAFEALEFDGL